jgi:hypothetical protein
MSDSKISNGIGTNSQNQVAVVKLKSTLPPPKIAINKSLCKLMQFHDD